jgi:hypothetical protein
VGYKITAFDLKLALMQYFRFRRQWLCVDEFRGADIIVDTKKEIIEVEVKISKSDLIHGEKAKIRKHLAYKQSRSFGMNRPNKFMFCVPETLVPVALTWSAQINPAYGVIGFDVRRFAVAVFSNFGIWHCNYIRIAKSAKQLHDSYKSEFRWAVCKRLSAKVAKQMEHDFMRKIEHTGSTVPATGHIAE